MKMNMQVITGVALLLSSSLAFGHSSDAVEDDVEAGSAGYVGAGDLVVKTGNGECLQTGELSDDNQVGTCAGIAEEPEPEPEPQATTETVEEPEPVTPEPTVVPVNKTISADFDTGSDTPTAEGEAAIAALIAELQGYQEIESIEVAGHTDSQGTDANNQALSEARAEAIRARLAGAFPNASITAVGYGETQPIASNDTAEGRAQNRRVEITAAAKSIQQ